MPFLSKLAIFDTTPIIMKNPSGHPGITSIPLVASNTFPQSHRPLLSYSKERTWSPLQYEYTFDVILFFSDSLNSRKRHLFSFYETNLVGTQLTNRIDRISKPAVALNESFTCIGPLFMKSVEMWILKLDFQQDQTTLGWNIALGFLQDNKARGGKMFKNGNVGLAHR